MKEVLKGSLEGIKVIDFSTLLPGPLASLFLSETGAEVIKIEKPGVGDEIRLSNPQWGEQSVSFSLLNRGKKSLSITINHPKKKRIGLFKDSIITSKYTISLNLKGLTLYIKAEIIKASDV